MLNAKQIDRMIIKLERFVDALDPLIFKKVGEINNVKAFKAGEKQYHQIPDESMFEPIEKGFKWNGEYNYCWFKGDFKVPDELDGKALFLKHHITGYEAMLWVDGKVYGTFATKIVQTAHGNHYCDLIKLSPKAGDTIDVALEWYSGHYIMGCMPFETNKKIVDFDYQGMDVCVKDYEIQDFYFDLLTVIDLEKSLDENSFRKADLINALYEVHNIVYYDKENCDDETFREALRQASPYLKKVLSVKNSESAAKAGLIGHSHMDTAWLWHVDETVKKCIRTYANQMSLMDQYPEYTFIQSSALHGEFVRKYNPDLFERIKERVKEGRYEPNSGVWVECDCNITSGESMIRQFLWGQRFTRKYYNYTSNSFWLPDTFGYSAAIPQIMKGCGVDYFLTTKIQWNDTNRFPYTSFYWEGIDGTKVLTHFNCTHFSTNPSTVRSLLVDGDDKVLEKTVDNTRLLSYGFGDGGGGPQYEMIEMTRRLKDLDGCPKSEYTTVGKFMNDLEKNIKNPPTYCGELYLEIHRGTLTNQHQIKRNNRKCEYNIRNLEYLTVNDAVKNDAVAEDKNIKPFVGTLLKNQFHDILPGTCVPRAHKESKAETFEILEKSDKLIDELVSQSSDNEVSLINTLSFDRNDPAFIDYKEGYIVDGGYPQQVYTDLDGNKKLIVSGVCVPAFSSVTLKLVPGKVESKNCFKSEDNNLETPFAKVKFDEKGFISSFVDLSCDRELCANDGYSLNTFIMAEDVPALWDNWDIDADIETKFKDTSELLEREIVSAGEVAWIVRSKYRISPKSTITQDMMFFTSTAEVRFDTQMDWNEEHRLLKTCFDTNVYENFARQEVQFGYIKRPTTRNNSIEQAKFEVLNHKYTDISETRYGVAVLNDCKYAVSLNKGKIRLSLHKGGVRPDYTGDKGLHRCVYSFLAHNCGFGTKAVIRPAYELNIPYIIANGKYDNENLFAVEADNIIIETIKPCEDNEKAFIVRLYDAEGTHTSTSFSTIARAKKIEITNMLEEVKEEINSDSKLTFHPFEIKTIKVSY